MVLQELIVVAGIALCTAGIVAVILRPQKSKSVFPDHVGQEPLSLMFVEGDLHHATNSALTKFALMPGTHSWEDLRQSLKVRFPDIPASSETGAIGSLTINSQNPADDGVVELNWRDGICWVEVRDPPKSPCDTDTSDRMPRAAKMCCDTMADAAWEVLPDGSVGWRNAACERLQTRLALPPNKEPFERVQTGTVDRRQVAGKHDQTDWYDIETYASRFTRIRIAKCITDLVRSEATQRSFVQTLSATFAHLSIGLAIFEKNGQLSIFNPALLDLTGLQPTVLVTRPTVLSFFDQLRENRCMPEPKDYGSWRQEISDMVSVAAEGCFKETWTLEDGRTFSVTGRPHAEGGTAFMFEDISSEVTLTRNFRIEMAQYEILLDTVADAIVVFSSTGVLTFCNASYRILWSHSPENTFADVTISDAIDLWREKLRSHVDWSSVAQMVHSLGHRQPQEMQLKLKNGRSLRCAASPVGTDATMIKFSPQEPAYAFDKARVR